MAFGKLPLPLRKGPRVDDPWQLLSTETSRWGLELEPDRLSRLKQFAERVVEVNTRLNLTRITEPRELVLKHFLDSLTVWRVLTGEERAGSRFLDIGSGPGFPGIPLAIALPGLRGTSLEATGKKVAFQREAIAALGVELDVIQGRAEELGRQAAHRERYDWVVARALAPLPTLAEYALPFVRVGGHFIAMKGSRAHEELQDATAAIRKLGGQLDRIESLELPDDEGERHLVVIRKVAPTPATYPRAGSVPRDRPILA